MKKSEIRVVAAVIEREGRILICQRKQGGRYEYKWEFPGGKVEADEDPRDALQRELREELDIESEVGPELARYEFQYPGRTAILLIFFSVLAFSNEPVNLIFERMVWETPERLPGYDFLDGDLDFVRRISKGYFRAKEA